MTDKEKARLEELAAMDARREHLRIFRLALLEQCKSENLTLDELDRILDGIKNDARQTTLRDGLTL